MRAANDLRTTAAIAVAAALLYAVLGQTTLYHNDGHRLLELLHRGDLNFGRHFLALPGMTLFHETIGTWGGLPPFRSLTLLSALGSGTATAITWAMAREFGASRAGATAAAALFGAVFPVLFFATIVEFHGLFLPFALATLWCGGRWARTRSPWAAAAAGVLAAVAMQLHATGALLPVTTAAMFWAETRLAPRRQRLRQIALLGITFTVLAGAFVWFWAALGWLTGSPLSAERRGWQLVLHGVSSLPRWTWSEWLLPFLPLSPLPLAALARRDLRASGLAILGPAGCYLALAATVLGIPEHGAYLAPLAAPLALLAVRMFGTRMALAAAAATALVNVGCVLVTDVEGARYRALAAGISSLAATDRVVVLYCEPKYGSDDEHVDELAAVRLFRPDTEVFQLQELAAREPAQLTPDPKVMAAAWRAIHAERRVLMTHGSLQRLRRWYPSGALLVAAFESVYELRPLRTADFDGFELVAR